MNDESLELTPSGLEEAGTSSESFEEFGRSIYKAALLAAAEEIKTNGSNVASFEVDAKLLVTACRHRHPHDNCHCVSFCVYVGVCSYCYTYCESFSVTRTDPN